jgi:hypothetical protein
LQGTGSDEEIKTLNAGNEEAEESGGSWKDKALKPKSAKHAQRY